LINTPYIFIAVISYLLGTFPSAWLLVKIFGRKNVLKAGTGNAGAMNSYEVTGKKWIGITVLLLDSLKAIIAIMIPIILMKVDNPSIELFFSMYIAAIFVLLGHNFNIFFKFKGGRGLATAAGALLIFDLINILIIWLIVFFITYLLIYRNKNLDDIKIHISSIAATMLLPVSVFLFYSGLIPNSIFFSWFMNQQLNWTITIMCIIILIKHIKPIYDFIKSKKIKK
jgi:acyl phosphate:glycerol-3-phosphate acyltransferase